VAASIATVTITSSIGTGSGFFVSENGHILTNRHVIRGDQQQMEAFETAIEKVDGEIEFAEKGLNTREKILSEEAEYLEEIRGYIENLPSGSSQQQDLQKKYQKRLENYQAFKEEYEQYKEKFDQKKGIFENEKSEFTSKRALAGVDQYFKVTLKNGETLDAYLVDVSTDNDLALLKVEGCKTPFLLAADSDRVSQRQKVWAIGSPLNQRDLVHEGIVSGITKDFIKTDAKIYPGNSGGPLVDEAGRAIGINTLKELTRNFEGLGYAIPIKTAMDEFNSELK